MERRVVHCGHEGCWASTERKGTPVPDRKPRTKETSDLRAAISPQWTWGRLRSLCRSPKSPASSGCPSPTSPPWTPHQNSPRSRPPPSSGPEASNLPAHAPERRRPAPAPPRPKPVQHLSVSTSVKPLCEDNAAHSLPTVGTAPCPASPPRDERYEHRCLTTRPRRKRAPVSPKREHRRQESTVVIS